MKKTLLLLAGAMLASVSVFAQPKKPVVTYTSFTDAVAAEEIVYLYNVESAAFLTGGNYWGTRACVVKSNSTGPNDNATLIELKKGTNGATVNGYKWLIAESGELDEDSNPCYSFANKSTSNYLTADGQSEIWVDGADTRPYSFWTVTDLGGNTFELGYEGLIGKFGIPEKFFGVENNVNTTFIDPELEYDHEIDGETVKDLVSEGKFATTWALVSEEEYERVLPLLQAYYRYDGLALILADAKKEYPTLDFSAEQAVYDNATESTTIEELNAAITSIEKKIEDYKASLATFDDPMDFTSIIGDGSDVGPWTQKFTGSGTTGTWHTNSWSTEANDGADGTDMTIPFCEDWVGQGNKLSDQKIYQVLKNAAPGLYKFTADVRLYNEAGGIDKFEGIKMYFGDESINLGEECEMYKSGNKCVLWNKNYFTFITILEETGDIEFGFDLKDVNFNWMAFKKTSLMYYGNEDCEENALKLFYQTYEYEKSEDARANQSIIDDYNSAIDAFYSATDIPSAKAGLPAIEAAYKALNENIEAYDNLENAITDLDSKVSESESVGILVDMMIDLLDPNAGEDALEAFAEEDVPAEYIPAVTPWSLLEELNYDTKEVNDYISQLSSLWSYCLSNSLGEGQDCTELIKDADFKDKNGTGWTQAFKAGNLAWTGGFEVFPVAESWRSTFDIYQEVKAPDGIYSISLNGFARRESGSEQTVPAEIYLNDFATPLMNILDDQLPVEEAQDGYNCYLTKDAAGAYHDNPLFAENDKHSSPNNATDKTGDKGYYPDGMEGASIAFSADRYKATVYGIVEGGVMKIGVRNTSANWWALWSNFKLTYEGTNPEAVDAIGNALSQRALDVLDSDQAEYLPKTMKDALEEANAAVEDADEDVKYEKVMELNNVLKEVNPMIEAVSQFIEAQDAMGRAAEDNIETASAEAKAEYDELSILDYSTMTKKEIEDATAAMIKCAKKLRVPDTTGASPSNPVDMTQVIDDPELEGCAVNGDKLGAWSWTKNAGNGPVYPYDSETSSAVEFWCDPATNNKFSLTQKLAGLPAGTYQLTVEAGNSYNGVESLGNEGYAAVFAAVPDMDEAVEPIATITGEATETDSYTVEFYIPEGTDEVTIGVKTIGDLDARWFYCDNFSLQYLGADVPTAIEEASSAAAAKATEIFSVTGAKLNATQKGINIVKMSNGQVKKVYIK